MTLIGNWIDLPLCFFFLASLLDSLNVSIQVNGNMLKRSKAKIVHLKVMIRYPSRRLFRSGCSHMASLWYRCTRNLLHRSPTRARARACARWSLLLRALRQIVIFLALGGAAVRKLTMWLLFGCFGGFGPPPILSLIRKEEHRGWLKPLHTTFKWFLFLWEKQKKMAY